jgi:hypothetical protein
VRRLGYYCFPPSRELPISTATLQLFQEPPTFAEQLQILLHRMNSISGFKHHQTPLSVQHARCLGPSQRSIIQVSRLLASTLQIPTIQTTYRFTMPMTRFNPKTDAFIPRPKPDPIANLFVPIQPFKLYSISWYPRLTSVDRHSILPPTHLSQIQLFELFSIHW